MRHLLLALMIALLPLRAWVGDAMAASMSVQQLVAIQNIAETPYSVRTEATFDHASEQKTVECPDHAAMALSGSEPPAGLVTGLHCGDCSSCDICHMVAFAEPLPTTEFAATHGALPLALSQHITSAERTTGFKPPIS